VEERGGGKEVDDWTWSQFHVVSLSCLTWHDMADEDVSRLSFRLYNTVPQTDEMRLFSPRKGLEKARVITITVMSRST
jgi:hypothetical protein